MAHSKAEGAGREQMASLPEDWVFALDIGTRSVIGLVGQRRGDTFELADVEVREHPNRAMVDGQIENIQQVAQVAGQVKESLESRLGMELRYVNVAAAGRALKTGRGVFSLDVGTGEPISSQQMYELEVGAIAAAREQVQKTQEITGRFYCVGHSVVRYHLDDYPFSTILGHKGEVAKAEVIATFLPTEVVDSLISAMTRIGCEISHMTLEPIAAMNAVIPPDLRLLNLALVDIGAGTSDIAISENGTVSAYTMATVAGDEVTEELIKKYLVEFQTAERMKHEATKGCGAITYRDILGFDNEISLEETLTTLQPAVESLAEEICRRLLEVNGKAPAAVFLVGGGSLTPGLCQCVAQKLGLDERRVAIGGENYIKRVIGGSGVVSGPAFATPIGIALTASTAGTGKGFYVTVNDEKVRLFRNDRMSIMDVLLSAGFQYKDIMGQSGKSITYTVNGEKRIKRGGYLVPAELYLNGKEASISTPVNCEDEIRFIPAQSGEDARLTLTDIGLDPCSIMVNFGATPVQAGRFVTINGKSAVSGQAITDFDAVAYTEAMTLRELCLQIGMEWRENTFLLGDVYASGDTPLQEGDTICYTQGFSAASTVLETPDPSSVQTAAEMQNTVSQSAVAQKPVAQTAEVQTAEVQAAEVQAAAEGESGAKPAAELSMAQKETLVQGTVSEHDLSKEAIDKDAELPMAQKEDLVQGTVSEHDLSKEAIDKDMEIRKPAAEQSGATSQPPAPAETVAKRVTPRPAVQPEASVRGGRVRTAASVRPISTMEKAKENVFASAITPAEGQKPQQSPLSVSVKLSAHETLESQAQGTSMEEPPVSLVGTEMLRNYPVGGMTQERQTGAAYPELAASLQEEKSREQKDSAENADSEAVSPERRRPAPGEPLRVLLNGEIRLLPPKQDHYDYLFVDLFTLVDIDPANPQGNIVLKLNGREPSYVDELFMDDVAEIYWDGQGL